MRHGLDSSKRYIMLMKQTSEEIATRLFAAYPEVFKPRSQEDLIEKYIEFLGKIEDAEIQGKMSKRNISKPNTPKR